MNIIDSHAKSLEASINALMHRSAINVHKDKESLFDERKRLERSRPRFSKSNDEDPPVISTLLQGRFSPRGRDEGETRERRGRDDRANASSSANYRLRSARFPVVATNFTNGRSLSSPLLRFSPSSISFSREKGEGRNEIEEIKDYSPPFVRRWIEKREREKGEKDLFFTEEKSRNRNFLRHSDLSMAGVKLNFPLWKVFN